MKNRLVIISLAIIWLIIALSLINYGQRIIDTGARVILKTIPVDPRDYLRGDYVVLNYEISLIDTVTIPSDLDYYGEGNKVFVVLEKQDFYWVVKEMRKDKPTDGSVFIAGTISWYFNDSRKVLITYGIENFFVPEGQGKYIENMMMRGIDLSVEVSLNQEGRGIIIKLYEQEKEIDLEKLGEQVN